MYEASISGALDSLAESARESNKLHKETQKLLRSALTSVDESLRRIADQQQKDSIGRPR